MEKQNLQVLYICGSGRSGSTILDIILSNQELSTGVGELNYLHRFIKSGHEFCACGEVFKECDFWPKVIKKWEDISLIKNPLETLHQKQQIFERFRGFPLSLIHRLFKTKTYKDYLCLAETLYQAIAEISGKNTIIDSSKNPLRAFHLSGQKTLNFNILHLIRDGRGVAYSLSKAWEKDIKKGIQTSLKAKPIWRTACFWIIMNLTAHIACLFSKHKSFFLRYEDFLKSPEVNLDYISKRFNLNYEDIKKKLRDKEPFITGHTVAGNRLRMNSAIKLKKRDNWSDSLSPKKQRQFTLIAAPFLWVYGYFK